MKPRVYFESPSPGSQGSGYIDGNLITFELVNCSSEVCGSGRTEFWGVSVSEFYTRHHVEEATVIAINEEPYDISLHGEEEKFLRLCQFCVEQAA